jgi:hypothetical protein
MLGCRRSSVRSRGSGSVTASSKWMEGGRARQRTALLCVRAAVRPRLVSLASHTPATFAMLIQKTFHDVPVTHGRDARAHMRVFVIAPNVPDYPQARFPGAPPFPACSRTQRS